MKIQSQFLNRTIILVLIYLLKIDHIMADAEFSNVNLFEGRFTIVAPQSTKTHETSLILPSLPTNPITLASVTLKSDKEDSKITNDDLIKFLKDSTQANQIEKLSDNRFLGTSILNKNGIDTYTWRIAKILPSGSLCILFLDIEYSKLNQGNIKVITDLAKSVQFNQDK